MTEPIASNSDNDQVTEASAETDAGDRLQRDFRLIRWGLVVTLVLSCGVAFALNLVDPDLWGHVKYGQEVLTDGSLPATATHTYTATDYRWINHENLSEIVFAFVYEHLGVHGLTIGKCLLGMGILGLMWLTARRRIVGKDGGRLEPLAMWAFLFLVTLNLATYFPVRPQLFSFALCAVMLVVLDRGFPDWPDRLTPRFAWLWCLPPLMALWINFHGGVVAGICILLAYLGGRSVELVVRSGAAPWGRFRRARPGTEVEAAGGGVSESDVGNASSQVQASLGERCMKAPWKAVGHLALVAVASVAALFVNPYGYELPYWLAESLSQPRPEVTEWAKISVADPVFLPFVMLCLLVLVAFAQGRRPRDWTQFALFLPVAWQAVAHVRHVAFFALLCGFFLPAMLSGVAARLRSKDADSPPDIAIAPWLRRAIVGALAAVFCLQTYNLTARVRELPVYRNFYPVDAIQFMAEQGLEGRLVVSFNWAQYALAALAPDVQLQFDGRYDTCYPPKAIDWHFDFLLGDHNGRRFRFPESGPLDGTTVLSADEPHLVLVDRTYPEAVANMEREIAERPSKWVLLYQDGIAQLYGRSDRYDDAKSLHYLPPEYRVITEKKRSDAVPWPALPPRGLRRFAVQ